MKLRSSCARRVAAASFIAALSTVSLADDVLSSNGFTNCLSNAAITVNNANIQYVKSTGFLTFDVSGTSEKTQNVKATLIVSAYGKQVYSNSFDPCGTNPHVAELCPVPAGNFFAQGNETLPPSAVSQIPSIAFSVPDLDGQATIKLTSTDTGEDVACVDTSVTNGKSVQVPAVSYIAAGIAASALALSGLTAFANAGHAGGHSSQPSFSTVMLWFQGVTFNGMMSVQTPAVYRKFTQNFAFSTGLISWNQMQNSIDTFRSKTGGNLTNDNVKYLQNATLAHTDGTSNQTTFDKRSIELFSNTLLEIRQVSAGIGGETTGQNSSGGNSNNQKVIHAVHGIQGYVEELSIPQANTFMTVLLVFAIVIAAITLGILLLKVILETWALFGSFPKRLTSFRKRYWITLGKTITNLILLLYGVWVLYCIFQFTHGDSWAAKTLAGITLGLFTSVLGFFTFRIWQIAHQAKKLQGDASELYQNKENWIKYSIFYDNYKQGYWWLFMPVIIYMFAKGCVLAGGDGHGLAQTVGQLVIESLMLMLLLWSRPFATGYGNWINVIIQVVRVLSVVCILVFVEQLGISQTTKTVTGVVLIAVQSVLTAVLAILIAVNALINCCRENPHRKRRKEAEKLNRDLDNLTPLDARNSLLLNSLDRKDTKSSVTASHGRQISMNMFNGRQGYDPVDQTGGGGRESPNAPKKWRGAGDESTEQLVGGAAGMGYQLRKEPSLESSYSRGLDDWNRAPTVPDVGAPGRKMS
ncbi:hypothetical protein MMC25_004489 [Agyrium rufum]|nr:hypothetical protein [Agyrium rufum]